MGRRRTDRFRARIREAQWALLAILAGGIWLPVSGKLWEDWQRYTSLSFGPIVVALALGHLWMRRRDLRRWEPATGWALWIVAPSAMLYVLAMLVDVDFLKFLAAMALTAGCVGYLGGRRAFGAAAGALGLLSFAIPLSLTLSERIAIPLQYSSIAYTALLGGALGLPVHRDGIRLMVSPDATVRYCIMVAQQCSGLKFLLVLLALGLLAALHTRVRFAWRALLVAGMVPLTILVNTFRITLVLLVGTYFGAAPAHWIHDWEPPVLILICSVSILALRGLLVRWDAHAKAPVRRVVGHADHDTVETRLIVGDLLDGPVPAIGP